MRNKTLPQDHSRLTGVLSEITTHFQNAESLRPVVTAQHEADRGTRRWDRLPPTAQQVILAAPDGLTITSAPPLSVHRFLNARNKTALQANCALTYSGNNIVLSSVFC